MRGSGEHLQEFTVLVLRYSSEMTDIVHPRGGELIDQSESSPSPRLHCPTLGGMYIAYSISATCGGAQA